MPAIFRPTTNVVTRVALLSVGVLLLGAVVWWWSWPRMDYVRHRDWTVEQPVPFSHQHHVAGLGLDCRFCHVTVETAADAGLPPTYTCMTCHSQIWTNAAILAPVRDSLANNTPLVWHRVTDLPDYVYFNHRIHIAKGVGCQSCHGTLQDMALSGKARTLTMGFCLDCHRDPAPNLRPRDAIFDTAWHRMPDTPSPAALMAQYHVGGRNLTDCSICHR
jgi:hypothetical protein